MQRIQLVYWASRICKHLLSLIHGYGARHKVLNLLIALVIVLRCSGAVQAAELNCTPTSGFNVCKRITYSGGAQSFTIPTGISSIETRVWGAAGGGANSAHWSNQGGGGAGGFSRGTVAVTGGQVMGVIVGQGGIVSSTSTTFGLGGGGGGSTITARIGSSGGGFSCVGSSAGCTPANALLMAGGGGGAASGADVNTPYAGGGGGTTGGQDANAAASGRGGTQVAGGAAATVNSNCSVLPTAGGPGTGGNGGSANGTGPNEGGGGGGGGRYGGGGGMCQNSTTVGVNGAGGGGSGYIAASVTSGSMTAGSNFTYGGGVCSGTANSGGSTESLYTAGIGQGSCFSNGGNGEVVIQYHMAQITLTMISNGAIGTYTITGNNGWTSQNISTATSGVGVAGAAQVLNAASTSTTLNVTIPAGYSMASTSCTGMGGGTMTPNYSTGAMVFNTTATAAANEIACTINLYKTPTFKLQITSYGNATTFTPSASTNLASTPGAIATSISGTAYPTSPTAINVTTIASSVTVTVPAPNAAWAITAVGCTDSNSAITGNMGTFGTFSGQVLTVAAANIVAGADLNCLITETKAYVFVKKISQGGTGSFSFASQTNLASVPIPVVTTTAGTAAPTVQSSNDYTNFLSMNTTSSITEATNSAYSATGFSCTDANASLTGNSGSFGSLAGLVGTIPSANVKAGAAITCVFTNSKIPTFKLQVTTIGGVGGPFTFTQTNLASTPASITTTAAGTTAPVSPTAINITTTGTQITVTGTPPSGFDLNAVSCTDANSSITGNTGSFGTLGGNQITVLGSLVVAGADITCVLTSNKLPTVTLTVVSNGTTGTFNFAGGNGFGSQSITTVSSGVGVTGATKILSAVSTATTLTETLTLNFVMTSASCTGMSSGLPTVTTSAGTIAFSAANLGPGAAIACTVTNTAATPALGMNKTPNVLSVSAAGQTVTYSIVVNNTGNTTLAPITISDPLGTVICPSSGGTTVTSLAAGTSETCSLTYSVPQIVFDNNGGGDGDIDNTASASATYNGSSVNSSATAAVNLVIAPSLAIDKQWSFANSGDDANGNGLADVGDVITYSYLVTNNGNVTVNNVLVNDVHNGDGSLGAISPTSVASLAPSNATTFTATYTVVQGDIDSQ